MLEIIKTTITAPSLASRGSAAGFANVIHSAAAKAVPVDADEMALVDSEAAWALKKITFDHVSDGTFKRLGPNTIAAAAKTSNLGNADSFMLADSEASNATKKLTWQTLKSQLGILGAGLPVTTTSTPPASPIDGQIWYEDDTGDVYIWYVDPDGGQWVQINGVTTGGITGGWDVTQYQTRTAAIAAEMQTSVIGIETLGYTTPGDGGGARYKRVASEPTHLGKFQSADGAWWELAEPGEVTLEMFGGKADSTNDYSLAFGVTTPNGTDNWPALQAALGYTKHNIFRTYSAVATIRLLRGIYFVSQMTEIDWNVRISGIGGAAVGKNYPSSILSYPENVTAFKFWAANTVGSHGGDSYGSILENVLLMGRGGTITYAPQQDGTYVNGDHSDATKHGVILYTTICMRQCAVQNFAGDGIHVDTLQGGSANELDFIAVKAGSNGRHGMYIEGGDTNAGSGLRVDCSSNGGFGLWDSSAYGNVWTGCHYDSNGIKTRVHHLGNHYNCVAYAYGGPDPSTVEPGTNSAVWELVTPGGPDPFYKEWISGNKYFAGGSFCTMAAAPSTGAGLAHVFVGCYMEGPQGSPRVNDQTIIISGANTTSVKGGMIFSGVGVQGKFGARQAVRNDLNLPGTSIMLGVSDTEPIRLYANEEETKGNTAGFGLGVWNATSGTFDIVHGTANTSVKFSTFGTNEVMAGRAAPLLPGRVVLPNLLFTGRTAALARMISFETAIPAVGPEYAKGDIVFNSAPVSGGNVGWICTQGGVIATATLWTSGLNAALNLYIRTAAGNFYRCTFDPQTLKAFTEPAHTFTATVVGADGYGWTYAGPTGVVRTAWAVGLNPVLGDVYRGASSQNYRCTTDPGAGLTSGSAPSHTSGEVVGADGYGWTYVEKLWVSGTDYVVGNLVEITALNAVYRCTTDPGVGVGSTVQPAHTPNAADNDLIKWDYLCNPPSVPLWVDNTNYPVGAMVRNSGGNIQRVLAKINDASLSTTEPTTVFEKPTQDFPAGYKWGYVCSLYNHETPLWVFGRTYLPNSTNEVSVLVRNNSTGNTYRCTQSRTTDLMSTQEPAHTSGEQLYSDGHKWWYISNTSPVWKTFGVVS